MRIFLLAAGKRSKFLVAAVMILVAFGLSSQSSQLEKILKDDTSDYLPQQAESLKALKVSEQITEQTLIPAIVVFRHDSGLTEGDRTTINDQVTSLNANPLPLAERAPPAQFSEDGKAAIVLVPFTEGEEQTQLPRSVEQLRDRTTQAFSGEGRETAVTGQAGFIADFSTIFEGLDSTLLLAAGGLILVLLILIYRSPVFWLIPFFTVVLAESSARGMAYLAGSAGLTINGQATGILSVLVFGAATDYALLLVSRYREELHTHQDKHAAMKVALRSTAPAILASGGTVILGLLLLSLAEVNSTASIGPLGAIGIALALVFSLTVLPALLTIFGRRAFWPIVPKYDRKHDQALHGIWSRVAALVGRRPRRIWIGVTALFLIFSAGLFQLNTNLADQDAFTKEVESVTGQKLLAKSFPAGQSVPTEVIVPPGGNVPAVKQALQSDTESVAAVTNEQANGSGTLLSVTLTKDPYSTEAEPLIKQIREVVHGTEPAALVGGQTAQTYDYNQSAKRDNLVIPPLVLLAILIVLIILLRAVVAPILLLLTVVLSFAGALGLSILIFIHIFDFPGIDPSIILLSFVFLVALGVDYNIFLMARAREEALKRGTRKGILAALSVTGGVITSAGVVLAGTFVVLGVLPIVFLAEMGTIVAIGVLLDTLLIRSLLVPALVHDLGAKAWWPSKAIKD